MKKKLERKTTKLSILYPLPFPLHYLQANSNDQSANGGKNGKNMGTNYSVRINQNQYKEFEIVKETPTTINI